jgi:excinuclease ABC subunit C
VGAAEHRRIVDDFCDFLAGRTDRMVRELEQRMHAAAEELDFETAARLRDDVQALRRALEKQAVVLGDGTDADVIAFATDELQVAVQVFHVRDGRVRGQRGWVVDKSGDAVDIPADGGDHSEQTEQAALVEQFLTQFYGEQVAVAEQSADDRPASVVPREVLVPRLPADADQV